MSALASFESVSASARALVSSNLEALMALDREALDEIQESFMGLNHCIHPMLHLITLCHGLNVTMRLRRLNPDIHTMPLMQCLIAFLVGSIGGGTLTGVLLGVPPKTFGMMNISTLFAVWFFMFALPFNPFVYILNYILPIRAVIVALANVSTAYCVFAGVDAGLSSGENEYVLAVLCGVLTATGGGLTSDLFSLHNHQWKFTVPEVLQSPSRRLGLPFICSVVYAATKSSAALEMVTDFGGPEAKPWLDLFIRYIYLLIGVVILLNATPSMFASTTGKKKVASFPPKKKKN